MGGLKGPTDVLAADAGIVGDETPDRRLSDGRNKCDDIDDIGECRIEDHCKWDSDANECVEKKKCKDIKRKLKCKSKDRCTWNEDDNTCRKNTDRRLGDMKPEENSV